MALGQDSQLAENGWLLLLKGSVFFNPERCPNDLTFTAIAPGHYPKWIDGIAETDRAFGINTYESELSTLANLETCYSWAVLLQEMVIYTVFYIYIYIYTC